MTTVAYRRHRTLRGIKGLLLDAVAAGPPEHGIDRWFHEDLPEFGLDALRTEQRRLQLRLLLTDPIERDRWPATWIAERLRRVEEELRANARGQ
jgi:hypothetical protein